MYRLTIILSWLLLIVSSLPALTVPSSAETAPPYRGGLVEPAQETFAVQRLTHDVYAAIAKIGGRATTNAFFAIGEDYVVAAGAHMTKDVIDDLYAAIAARTDKPVKFFILAHHHPGYTHVDFDFPADQNVIMTWQAWQTLDEEIRKPEYPILFFNEGLTLKPGGVTVILTNVGKGHTDGDLIAYIPEAETVFASDLLYVNSVGYMAGGYMTEWVLALDFLEQFGASRIIPGYGPVSGSEEVAEFKEFFRDFLTAVITRIERGDTLEEVLADFELPEYRDMDGYQQLIKLNLKRAYEDLKRIY